MFEPGDALGHVALARQRLAFALECRPGARGRGDRSQFRVVAAVGVEQRQLAGLRQQGLVRVLAVDLD